MQVGKVYEKRVNKLLLRMMAEHPEYTLHHGYWIDYCDDNGRGKAQVDFLLVSEKCCIVIEAKLTRVLDAQRKLRYLYKPLVQHIFKRPVAIVEVCRHMIETENMHYVRSPFEAQDDGNLYSWHELLMQ